MFLCYENRKQKGKLISLFLSLFKVSVIDVGLCKIKTEHMIVRLAFPDLAGGHQELKLDSEN